MQSFAYNYENGILFVKLEGVFMADFFSVTEENFQKEVLQSALPTLVDFWAVWCGPCKALSPVIDELASEYTGKINVFKLNVDDNPDTAARYGIRGIPTVLLFKGGQVVQQAVGVAPKEHFQKIINNSL